MHKYAYFLSALVCGPTFAFVGCADAYLDELPALDTSFFVAYEDNANYANTLATPPGMDAVVLRNDVESWPDGGQYVGNVFELANGDRIEVGHSVRGPNGALLYTALPVTIGADVMLAVDEYMLDLPIVEQGLAIHVEGRLEFVLSDRWLDDRSRLDIVAVLGDKIGRARVPCGVRPVYEIDFRFAGERVSLKPGTTGRIADAGDSYVIAAIRALGPGDFHEAEPGCDESADYVSEDLRWAAWRQK